MRDNRSIPTGFTLLELLLALAVVSFVCIGLYSVYDGVLRVVETVDKMAKQDEISRTVTMLFRNDLLSIYYRKWGEIPQDSPLRVQVPAKVQRKQVPGDGRDVVVLEFAAATSPLFGNPADMGRIARIVYALRPSLNHAEAYLLLRKELPFAEMNWRSQAAQPWREIVVADMVTSLDVKVYASDGTQHVAWDSLEMERKGRPVLPAAFTIEVRRMVEGRMVSWSTSISVPPLELSFERETS